MEIAAKIYIYYQHAEILKKLICNCGSEYFVPEDNDLWCKECGVAIDINRHSTRQVRFVFDGGEA